MENQPTENVAPTQIENAPKEPEQKPQNTKTPIIIAVIIAAALLIAATVLVIVFSNKAPENPTPETPEQPVDVEEVDSYIIFEEGDISDSLVELIDSTHVITSYTELRSLYNDIGAHYARSYPLPIDDTDDDEQTKCGDESEDTKCNLEVMPTNAYYPVVEHRELDEEFFTDYDLLVVRFENGWCGGGFNRIRNVNKEDDTVTIEIGYDGSCGPCASTTSIILVQVEKDFATESDTFKTKEIMENDPFCNPTVSEKPMIYLYPEEETGISVKLGKPELLTATYPKYNKDSGWQVVAKPDGTLISGGREYYGLYWEGINKAEQKDEGFVVAGKDTAKFLEEKLEILGLNEREANEFIIYWLPKMEDSSYNYIRFATSAEIEKAMPLEVSPKPETTIRILMEFEPLNQKIEVKEQKLEKVERKGYTVVEWGGTEIK